MVEPLPVLGNSGGDNSNIILETVETSLQNTPNTASHVDETSDATKSTTNNVNNVDITMEEMRDQYHNQNHNQNQNQEHSQSQKTNPHQHQLQQKKQENEQPNQGQGRRRKQRAQAPPMTIEECLFGIKKDNEEPPLEDTTKTTKMIKTLKPTTNHVIDLIQLRKVASQGMDGESINVSSTGSGTGYRALTWRVLLGYLPKQTNKWQSVLRDQRDLYHSLCKELFVLDLNDTNGDALRRQHRCSRQHNEGIDPFTRASVKNVPETESEPNPNPTNEQQLSPQKNEQQTEATEEEERNEDEERSDHDNESDSNDDINYNYVLPEGSKEWKLDAKQKEVLDRLCKSSAINKLVIKNEEWNNFMENAALLDEIRKDVIRTHPNLYFFLDPSQDNVGKKRYAALERILFVWAKLNKGVRYVQGMNEIVGTVYYVLANDFHNEWASQAESDTYFIFNILMMDMRDIFVADLDNAETGIQGRISNMQNLLSIHDPEVFQHLNECGIDASFYAVRWLTTLLSREFLLPDTIRLWDSMFASTHKENFLRYVCATMVTSMRNELLVGDFSVCLRLLQSYPPIYTMDQLLECSRALWIYESQITAACHRAGVSLNTALQAIAPPPSIIVAFGLRGGVSLSNAEKLEQASQQAKETIQSTATAISSAGKEASEKAKEAMRDATASVSSASQGLFGSARRLLNGFGKDFKRTTSITKAQASEENEEEIITYSTITEYQEERHSEPEYATTQRSRFWKDTDKGKQQSKKITEESLVPVSQLSLQDDDGNCDVSENRQRTESTLSSPSDHAE